MACFRCFVGDEEESLEELVARCPDEKEAARHPRLARLLEELRRDSSWLGATLVPRLEGASRASTAGPLDACVAAAVRTFHGYAASKEFQVCNHDGSKVVLSKLPVQHAPFPVLRGTCGFDCARLEPRLGQCAKELWAVLPEFASALSSYEARLSVEENVVSQQLILDEPGAQLILTNTRPNATGNKYDYLVAYGCQSTDDRVTVVQTSLPPTAQEQVPRGVRAPGADGFTRNFMHLGGFDVRQVGLSSSGHPLLEVTHIVHTDLEQLGLVFQRLKYLICGQLLRSMQILMNRICACVEGGVYSSVASGPPAMSGLKEELLELPLPGRALLLPRFVHAALHPRLTTAAPAPSPRRSPPIHAGAAALAKSARGSSAGRKHPTLLESQNPMESKVPQQPLRPSADETAVDATAQEALARLQELARSRDWRPEEVGAQPLGIVSEGCSVSGVKLPAFRCRLPAFALPSRFGGDLRRAAFESAAAWINQATSVMCHPDREADAALLRTSAGSTAHWQTPVPDSLKLMPPLHFVVARTSEVQQNGDEISVRIVQSSLPAALADRLLDKAALPELHRDQRDRLYLESVEFCVRRQGEHLMLEVTTIAAAHGDPIPSFIPTFLLRKELSVLQPARLVRFHRILSAGFYPMTCITTHGTAHPGLAQCAVLVGGESWTVDASARKIWEDLKMD